MPTEEEDTENYLDELMAIYILSLYKASLKVQVSTSHYALEALNQARATAGLEAVKLDSKIVMNDAVKAANEYKKLLDKGGSLVIEKADDTEKLVFKPWLNSLRVDTKEKVFDIMKRAKDEGLTAEQIREEYNQIEEFMKKKRAKAAAFSETRVQQYQATMKTWESGGLEYVQRHMSGHSNVCSICLGLDRQVFRLGEQPDLSHFNCMCTYSPYITKDAKY